MAFIFSDLVVFPVLRINAKDYGWKIALYIMLTFLLVLVATSLLIHYGFALTGLQPEVEGGKKVTEQEFFAVDYTLLLNGAFLLVSGALVWIGTVFGGLNVRSLQMGTKSRIENVLFYLAWLAYFWLAAGIVLKLTIGQ